MPQVVIAAIGSQSTQVSCQIIVLNRGQGSACSCRQEKPCVCEAVRNQSVSRLRIIALSVYSVHGFARFRPKASMQYCSDSKSHIQIGLVVWLDWTSARKLVILICAKRIHLGVVVQKLGLMYHCSCYRARRLKIQELEAMPTYWGAKVYEAYTKCRQIILPSLFRQVCLLFFVRSKSGWN